MPVRIWVVGMRTSSVPSGKEIEGAADGLAAGRPTDAGAVDGTAGAADGATGAGADADAGAGAAVAAVAAAGLVPSASDWPPTDRPNRWVSTEFGTSSRV